jgi:ribosome-binding protein aMBF1 (putative translation factor)
MNLHEATRLLLENEEFRKEYEKPDLAYDIARSIVDARIDRGISQVKLAEMIGTKQSSIARAESGNTLPSLSFIAKIANALGYRLEAPRLTDERLTVSSGNGRDNQWGHAGSIARVLPEIVANADARETVDARESVASKLSGWRFVK